MNFSEGRLDRISAWVAVLISGVVLVGSPTPLLAQANNPRPANQTNQPVQRTPEQTRAFIADVQANVEKGCLATKKPASACRCYAASYVKRYTPKELDAINNTASIMSATGQLQLFTQMTSLMLAPERRACNL